MAYIRIDKDLIDDPRLVALADRLSKQFALDRALLRNTLLGVTVTLWRYADTHIRSDNTLEISLDALAGIVGAPPEMLAALPSDWLKVRDDGQIELPEYCEKNGIAARDRRRELGRLRVQKWREKQGHDVTQKCNAGNECYTGTETVTKTKKKNTSAPPSAAPPDTVISLPCVGDAECHITESQCAEWGTLFPAVDVRQELRNMRAWLLASPSRRKTLKGAMRFATSWLARQQDRGPRPSPTTSNPPAKRAHAERDIEALARQLGLSAKPGETWEQFGMRVRREAERRSA